ncbi:MAG: hypothetical protein ACO3GR_05105 [Candidatus Kapaibacteriota bacterium]
MRNKTLSAHALLSEGGTIRGNSFESCFALRDALLAMVLLSSIVPL